MRGCGAIIGQWRVTRGGGILKDSTIENEIVNRYGTFCTVSRYSTLLFQILNKKALFFGLYCTVPRSQDVIFIQPVRDTGFIYVYP